MWGLSKKITGVAREMRRFYTLGPELGIVETGTLERKA
jgi:hypothetical protein